ncbi:hypothetical protein O181_080225 [Austropuccinia psidii MF-1]|uniref:Uncharacterized protein n=1 Tax=Austropuccinia psidii MF-1 TaxID=1389203 RepID=A0A9Q3FGI0_9BASI|nr:hypothetical protein [Austropuccinia psidii MF-1]
MFSFCTNNIFAKIKSLQLPVVRQNYALTQNLPKRYLKIINDINAHSDDELHPVHEFYVVETLIFHSDNENAFFKRLDKPISHRKGLSGKPKPKKQFCRPKVLQISELKTSLLAFPIYFYNAQWFNGLPPVEHLSSADTSQVAFIPATQAPTNGTPHPDEHLQRSIGKPSLQNVIFLMK